GQPANAASSSPGDTVPPAANPPAPSTETAQPLRSDRPSEP
ncbi:twin-arginine translocase subunit TatB, partial [Stutzerimonas stutzeri]